MSKAVNTNSRTVTFDLSEPETETIEYIQLTPLGMQQLRSTPLLFTEVQLTTMVNCVSAKRFVDLYKIVLDTISYRLEPMKFAEIVANLQMRKYIVTKSETRALNKPHSYQGTLTVNPNGTITFMPDEPMYAEAYGHTPLLTIKFDATKISQFRPISIIARLIKVL